MRKLTGNWYLQKGFWGYKVMVEVIKTDTCMEDFSQSPEYTVYEKARPSDFIELKIPVA